jgi:hypothetical protein
MKLKMKWSLFLTSFKVGFNEFKVRNIFLKFTVNFKKYFLLPEVTVLQIRSSQQLPHRITFYSNWNLDPYFPIGVAALEDRCILYFLGSPRRRSFPLGKFFKAGPSRNKKKIEKNSITPGCNFPASFAFTHSFYLFYGYFFQREGRCKLFFRNKCWDFFKKEIMIGVGHVTFFIASNRVARRKHIFF